MSEGALQGIGVGRIEEEEGMIEMENCHGLDTNLQLGDAGTENAAAAPASSTLPYNVSLFHFDFPGEEALQDESRRTAVGPQSIGPERANLGAFLRWKFLVPQTGRLQAIIKSAAEVDNNLGRVIEFALEAARQENVAWNDEVRFVTCGYLIGTTHIAACVGEGDEMGWMAFLAGVQHRLYHDRMDVEVLVEILFNGAGEGFTM